MSETMNFDGELIPCNDVWRIAIRRQYRNLRRRGYGPMTAHEMIMKEYVTQ